MLRIDIKDEGVTRMLKRVAEKGRDMKGALSIIGERVLRQTDDRWARNIDPEGRPWQSPKGSSWKKKTNPLILVERGHLRGSIRYRVSGHTLIVGTNKVYARILHEGGKTGPHEIRPRAYVDGRDARGRFVAKGTGGKRALFWPGAAHPVRVVHHPGSTFPARPFLGVGRADAADIVEVLTDWLEAAAR